jgi:hypothetical protein
MKKIPEARLLIIELTDEDGNEYKEIECNLVGEWRHGTEHEAIYQRVSDGTYWAACYRSTKDDGITWDCGVSVYLVEQKEKVVRTWEPVQS